MLVQPKDFEFNVNSQFNKAKKNQMVSKILITWQ